MSERKSRSRLYYHAPKEHRVIRVMTYAEMLEKEGVDRARRRERLQSAEGAHTQDDLDAIRKCQDDRCRYCFTPLNGKGHRDHIVALVRGGSNDPDNLQWVCALCSGRKGSKPEQQFLAEIWGS